MKNRILSALLCLLLVAVTTVLEGKNHDKIF